MKVRTKLVIIAIAFFVISGAAFLVGPSAASAIMKIVYDIRLADGLVGYWTFNGKDLDWSQSTTEARDSSGNGNHGNAINFGQSAAIPGMVGQALSFDGTDDYVQTGNQELWELQQGTFAVWFKNSVDTGARQSMVDSYNYVSSVTNGVFLAIAAGGFLRGGVFTTGASPDINGTTVVTDGKWHLGVITWDGTLRVYVDGVQENSAAHGATVKYPVGTDTDLTIGAETYGVTTDGYVNGLLDEVRVYNRALSAAEITELYRRGAREFGSKSITPNNNGLVGFWNFDNCDTCVTAKDYSSQGNDGTITDANASGLKNRVAGKINNALSFDGTDDYMEIGSDDPLENYVSQKPSTMALWFKSTSASYGQMFSLEGYYYIGLNADGTVLGEVSGDGVGPTSATSLNDGKWHYAVVTNDETTSKLYIDGQLSNSQADAPFNLTSVARDAVIGASGNTIGSPPNYPYNGLLDEVRIYNRALSAAEVQTLYEGTRRIYVNTSQNSRFTDGLVGMWSFNGPDMDWSQSTAEARDSSGSGNHGDVTNFGQEAARPGVVGQALSFDGSNDYISIGDKDLVTGKTMTASVWIKTGDIAQYETIVGKRYNFYSWALEGDSTANKIKFFVSASADTDKAVSNSALNDNIWHHVVGVYDGNLGSANIQLYVDGILQTTTANQTINIPSTADHESIGAERGVSVDCCYFTGLIDEVRIYNRAFSAAEVYELYKSGRRE